ncbi:hypothetical protein COB55_01210 [Candidatus Wolfebacteria bacterium]|nr:MAG: hypothetical protein COB55_01210 [Candidatus Wolfebacteria bacterium]
MNIMHKIFFVLYLLAAIWPLPYVLHVYINYGGGLATPERWIIAVVLTLIMGFLSYTHLKTYRSPKYILSERFFAASSVVNLLVFLVFVFLYWACDGGAGCMVLFPFLIILPLILALSCIVAIATLIRRHMSVFIQAE